MWFVEPEPCRIEAFQLQDERWFVAGTWSDDADARIPPFDAVPLDLTQLWARGNLEP